MTEAQTYAAYKLATDPNVTNAHDLIQKARPEWEFVGRRGAWIESHVTGAPEQSEPYKVLQGALNNMAQELGSTFLDQTSAALL